MVTVAVHPEENSEVVTVADPEIFAQLCVFGLLSAVDAVGSAHEDHRPKGLRGHHPQLACRPEIWQATMLSCVQSLLSSTEELAGNFQK